MNSIEKSVKNKIFAIIVFYIIAIVLRYITNKTPFLENIDSSFLKIVLQGIGPAIGAIIALKLFRLKTSYSLVGRLKPFLLSFFIFIAIPVIGFSIIGLNESNGLTITSNIHIASAKFSLYFIIYAILEEIGWRAFLNEQLSFVNEYVKIILIGILWFVWHLNFALTISNFIFLLILIFASWGIGKVGNSTKSILAVGVFHAFYNLLSTDNFPTTDKYIVLSVSAFMWFIFIVFYDKLRMKLTKKSG